MKQHLHSLLARLTKYFDQLRGDRTFRTISVNNDPNEAYRIQANTGMIVLYCTETIYRVCFKNWWVPDQLHYIYKVYGICEAGIPPVFAAGVARGFHIGRLLPHTASRSDQKKAAIHAYINMLVAEMERGAA